MTDSPGVIFDLDGTLADTIQDISSAVNTALADCGEPTHPVESYKRWVGDGLAKLIDRAVGRHDAGLIRRVTPIVEENYRLHQLDHSTLYAGVPELLDALQARGIPLAVLSNKPQEFTVAMVEALCRPWTFARVQGCVDGVPRKPDPRAVEPVLASLGRARHRIFFVGDTAGDIQTARGAGLISVGVTWGFRAEDELRQAGADHIIHRPEELLDCLGG